MSPKHTSFKSESNKDLSHPFHSGGKMLATNVPDNLRHHKTDVPGATNKNWKNVQMRSVLPSAVEEEYPDLTYYVNPIKKVENDQDAPSVHALLRSIDPMFNVIVQVFNGQKKMFAFPIAFRHFIVDSEHTSLIGYKELHHMVASHANHNLVRRQYKPVFTFGEGTKNGSEIDLCIDAHVPEMGDYTLTMRNYVVTICGSYHEHKKIVFNAYCSKSPFHDHISKPSSFIENHSGRKQGNSYRVANNQVAMHTHELLSKSSDLQEEGIYQDSLHMKMKMVSNSFNPFAKMLIKVFSQGEQVTTFHCSCIILLIVRLEDSLI